MLKTKIPNDYKSDLTLQETEFAIKLVKDYFQQNLAEKLNLSRVSAPLFLIPESGLNDDLNGVERPVEFDCLAFSGKVQIIHSLAKWKRMALHRYQFNIGEGLYTDMNAIRRDEELDNIHSIYVDQWDWEKIINKSDRNKNTLKETVRTIYQVFKDTNQFIAKKFPSLEHQLPEEITFITTQELENMYPELTSKEKENAIAEKFKTVFIMEIGNLLKSGEKHDGRAPDYDDWNLNGDIIVYNPILKQAFEISSMGVRVDEIVLKEQLIKADCLNREKFEFHKMLLNKELPYTIGGGIGQSRLCMFFLHKAHIGEVQSTLWDDETIKICQEQNINLL